MLMNGDCERILIKVERRCPPDLIKYETLDELKYVNEPTISSKTDNFGIEGGDLKLICTFYGVIEGGFSIDWKLPNDVIREVIYSFDNNNNQIKKSIFFNRE